MWHASGSVLVVLRTGFGLRLLLPSWKELWVLRGWGAAWWGAQGSGTHIPSAVCTCLTPAWAAER